MNIFESTKIFFDNFFSVFAGFAIPLKSQFRILEFYGSANGNPLLPYFNINQIVGRKIVIKAIKVLPFYSAASIDLTLSDGATINNETIPLGGRILRVFEDFKVPTNMSLLINGTQNDLFAASDLTAAAGGSNSWIDLDIDNINYSYPEKIQSLGFTVNSSMITDIATNANTVPNVRVFIQCYLI